MKALAEQLRAERDEESSLAYLLSKQAAREFFRDRPAWSTLKALAEVYPHRYALLAKRRGPYRDYFLQSLFERAADPAGVLMSSAAWDRFWTQYFRAPIVPDIAIETFWQCIVLTFEKTCREIERDRRQRFLESCKAIAPLRAQPGPKKRKI